MFLYFNIFNKINNITNTYITLKKSEQLQTKVRVVNYKEFGQS